MPHQEQNVSDHHQGDALDITVTVEDDSGTATDISGASAEYLLLENASDPDADALLTKDTAGGGIAITDAANGELVIHIETGDTSSFVGQKHHRLRVTDSSSDRVTVFTGSFTIEY
jgi:hypothetical protein